MSKYRSYLITGGAGFIGSHLAKHLADASCKVTVLDTVTPLQAKERLSGHIQYVQGNVMNADLIDRLVASHDCIYHLAAMLGVKRTMDEPAEMIENNVIGTLQVLKAAKRYHKRLIFASSSEVYGKTNPPFQETSDQLYGPTVKLRWSYATAKSLEEFLCLSYAKEGTEVTVLRYFNIYGPGQKGGPYGGVITKFIQSALKNAAITVYGDGSQTRCFTYIADAVAATAAAERESAIGEVINIGTEHEISIYALARKIKALTGSQSIIINVPYNRVYPHGFEEIPRRLPDTQKLKQLLHFYPSSDLKAGLQQTIRWHADAMLQSD